MEIKKQHSNSGSKIGPPGRYGKDGKDGILPRNIILDSGCVMKGDIDMALNSIKGVAYPVDLNYCCPKSYIDDGRNLLPADNIKASNASFSRDINLNKHRIKGVGAAFELEDAVTKAYVDSKITIMPKSIFTSTNAIISI